MKSTIILLFAVAFALSVSCSGNKEEKVKEKNDMASQQTGHGTASDPHDLSQLADQTSTDDLNDPHLKLANFTMTVPAAWQKTRPENQMRISQFEIKKHPEVKIAGFYFGEQDMIQDNITRWRGEFTKEDSFNETKLQGDKIVMVQIYGTFKLKPFPMAQEFTATPDYGALEAIVPSSQGPYYFKMTGPKDVIKGEIDNFKSFLNSYK